MGKKNHYHRQRGESIYEGSRENLQKDQMLPYTILTGGRDLDSPGTGALLNSTIPQRKDKELRQSKVSSTALQYTQSTESTEHVDTGVNTQARGM
jgi:hypothetical protein